MTVLRTGLLLATQALLAADNTVHVLDDWPFARTTLERCGTYLAHAHEVDMASTVGMSLWAKAKTLWQGNSDR